MQLCSPISTSDCADSPRWLKPPLLKLPHSSGGPQSEGVVGFNFVVAADGSVHDMEILKSSADELKEEVAASFENWKFVPATFQGRSVAVEMRAIVQFHATGGVTVSLGSRRASWTDPDELQKLHVEADQAYGRRDYENAVALSRQLLALEPLYRGVRVVLGLSLIELQQYGDAEGALFEEIRLDPKSAFAYNALGLAYQRQHKYDEAIAQFKKQIDVTPEAFNPHVNLGVLLCA